MKIKHFKISLIILVAVLALIGAWLYYYNCIETITQYCLIKVTPPQEEPSIFGGVTYSKPKFEFEPISKLYANDSIAVSDQKREKEKTDEFLLAELEKFGREKPSDRTEEITPAARLNAITSMLSRHYILVRATHTRSFSAEEVMKMLQEHWTDNSLETYAKDHKVEVSIYNL